MNERVVGWFFLGVAVSLTIFASDLPEVWQPIAYITAGYFAGATYDLRYAANPSKEKE